MIWMRDLVMIVKNLIVMLESFADDAELVVEIAKESDEVISTYDIGFSISESGEPMLLVHE